MSDYGGTGSLASKLQSWIMQEMHFNSSENFGGSLSLNVNSLKGICRSSQLADVWAYVLDCVCSAQTVKKIKGNLHLQAALGRPIHLVQGDQGKEHDCEYSMLLEKRMKLRNKIASVMSENCHFEEELKNTKQEILDTENEYRQQIEAERNFARKACLLDVYANTTNNDISRIDMIADQLHDKYRSVIDRSESRDSSGVHYQSSAVCGTEECDVLGAAHMESSISRDVRLCCTEIEVFLHRSIDEDIAKSDSFSNGKECLLQSIEATLEQHCIYDILHSLVHHCQTEAKNLKVQVMNIDVRKDTEKLRLKYENGGFQPGDASQMAVLSSVHQLLEETRLQHVMRFVDTERHRNKHQSQLKRLQATQLDIDKMLRQLFSSSGNVYETARMLVQSRLRLAADRTGVEVFLRQQADLRDKILDGVTHQKLVMSLFRTIQSFQQLTNTKQDVLQTVAEQNACSKFRLTSLQSDIHDYTKSSFSSFSQDISSLTKGLRGNVKKEVNRMSSLALPFLMQVFVDRGDCRRLVDMSINHMNHPMSSVLRPALVASLRHLDLPIYLASEFVSPSCLRLRLEQEENKRMVDSYKENSRAVLPHCNMQTVMGVVPDIHQQVDQYDRAKLATNLPVLHKLISKAVHSTSSAMRVKDHIQTWWHQQAQFTAPWVTLDDMTFSQWHTRWMIAVSKSRQLDIQSK